MLSDEEREALRNFKSEYETCNHNNSDLIIELDDAKIILNLIEKQSKEIEELKAISEYREKIIKGLGLKTLPKTITGFKELIENNDKKWEDKIKAKIEELKQEKSEYEDTPEWELFDYLEGQIEVLQSLLEKEE